MIDHFAIEVHDRFEPVLGAWAELESVAPASIYQTRRWLKPWAEHMCAEQGLSPMLVLVRDQGGRAIALLPLGVRRAGRVRIAEFLGGRDSNANMGLFRPGVAFSGAGIRMILSRAAAACPARLDAYVLANQPFAWGGTPNPLSQLSHQASPSYLHSAALCGDAAAFVAARQSSNARKKIRMKAKRLSALGEVRLMRAADEETGRSLLSVLIAQMEARLVAMGVTVAGAMSPARRAFLETACLTDISGAPAIELYALMAGECVAAAMGGGAHRGRFHGMINAHDMDPSIAVNSPGEILLLHLVTDQCLRGVAQFDLGIGEARYKGTWCDRAEGLFDALHAVTPLGVAFCVGERVRRRLKRVVKQSEWLWPFAAQLRKRINVLRARRGSARHDSPRDPSNT